MCLACELDALWYAEWERLASAGSAGISAAVSDDPAGAESEEPKGEEAKSAGETPLPGSMAASRTRFLCEETE